MTLGIGKIHCVGCNAIFVPEDIVNGIELQKIKIDEIRMSKNMARITVEKDIKDQSRPAVKQITGEDYDSMVNDLQAKAVAKYPIEAIELEETEDEIIFAVYKTRQTGKTVDAGDHIEIKCPRCDTIAIRCSK